MRFRLFFSCVLLLNFSSYSQSRKLFIEESFEDVNFLDNWAGLERCCSYSVQRSNSIAKSGNYSLRVELNYGKVKSEFVNRAELKLSSEETPYVKRKYKFSIYLPKEFKEDSIPEIVAQWHEVPDWHLGENWRSPPISLQIVKNRWNLVVMWSADSVNSNKTVGGRRIFDLGEIEVDKWTDWSLDIDYSYTYSGVIKIYRDGETVLKYMGPNYYNDKRGPYFKIGIYKWDWGRRSTLPIVNRRVLFFDDIKIEEVNED